MSIDEKALRAAQAAYHQYKNIDPAESVAQHIDSAVKNAIEAYEAAKAPATGQPNCGDSIIADPDFVAGQRAKNSRLNELMESVVVNPAPTATRQPDETPENAHKSFATGYIQRQVDAAKEGFSRTWGIGASTEDEKNAALEAFKAIRSCVETYLSKDTAHELLSRLIRVEEYLRHPEREAVYQMQPIESAPRDGSEILWQGVEGGYCVIHWDTYRECFEEEGSRWMLLPGDNRRRGRYD